MCSSNLQNGIISLGFAVAAIPGQHAAVDSKETVP